MTPKELLRLKNQLTADIKALKTMIWQAGCLTADFQVLIDPWVGKIYHMDFDRC
jgi:hypothetical protein